jgi:hypothetical protein
MMIKLKLGATIAAFVLGLAPALAIAAHPNNGKHGSQSKSQANAQAFEKLCSKESKKHVALGKATPFSQCTAAMKKAASGKAKSPGQACKGMSKKHVAGMKGTPYSQCVVAAAHLLGDKGGTSTGTSTPASTTTG